MSVNIGQQASPSGVGHGVRKGLMWLMQHAEESRQRTQLGHLQAYFSGQILLICRRVTLT